MAGRSFSHRHHGEKGQLVPYQKDSIRTRVPLLPYEWDLIRTLGISEEEYCDYVEKVRAQSLKRPAGYEAIPDIQNGTVVAIVVSLVIGIATTLLAPKPAAPKIQQKEQGPGTQRQLSSLEGGDRFGATSGFSGVSSLADYQKPIQVIFGLREDGVGGILVSPELVWSRLFSYGTEQAAKLLFVVGEAGPAEGIAKPSLAGMFMGTNPLDTAHINKMAFYWKRNTHGERRIKARNLAYGTRGSTQSADIQNDDDIFLVPNREVEKTEAFSGAFTPSGNVAFGCYSPIANGTGHRVNFRLVPMPQNKDEDGDVITQNRAILERVKISGDFGKDQNNRRMLDLGQTGLGREYNRFMGITEINGQKAPGGADGHKIKVEAKIGDTCVFTILGGVLAENTYNKDDGRVTVSVDDINNTTIQYREQADDTLQIGTNIMIGRTLWVVEARSIQIWGKQTNDPYKERETQRITLKCIDALGTGGIGNQIGVISDQCNREPIRTDDQGFGTYSYPKGELKGMTVGPGFYPLMKVSLATVRNTRPTDTTEIGIKSQVWNRASNLCNFGPLPYPAELKESDRRRESVSSGFMNTYLKRTSVFTLQLRPAGADENGNPYKWDTIGEQFAIQGSSPVDQYNFIRLVHPERRQYEFRFFPKNGADLVQHTKDEEPFWLLDARLNNSTGQGRLSGQYETNYGTFGLVSAGRVVNKGSIEYLPEMSTGSEENNSGPIYIDVPTELSPFKYHPDIEDSSAKATAVIFEGEYLPFGYSQGRLAALAWELWGQATSFGLQKSVNRRFNTNDGTWIELRLTGRVSEYFPDNHPHYPGWRAWNLIGVEVVNSSGGMNNNMALECVVPISGSNPRNAYGLPSTGLRVRVTDTTELSGPGGRESAWEYERLGSADSRSVGTTKTVTFDLSSDNSDGTLSVAFTATVVRAPELLQETFGIKNAWENEVYKVVPGSVSGTWSAGMTAKETQTVSAGNPFMDRGEKVGLWFQASNMQQVETAPGMSGKRVFEQNGQITDLANYKERQTSCESNPEHEVVYVNETIGNDGKVPEYERLTTCGLVLRAGDAFSSIDKLRLWLRGGIEVKRFHPSERDGYGPSNMLPDLLYYLLTDNVGGIGATFPSELIDEDSLSKACQFLRANKLFYNGAVSEPQNLRSWISGVAPYFLLNFVIANGKFALQPALPVDSAGNISLGSVDIAGLFTSGNIIEDTFGVEYLDMEQRRPFAAAMRWRVEWENGLAEERVLSVREQVPGSENFPMESIDLTAFCTSRRHAELAARFALSLRKRITHTVTFKTTPYGLELAPGDFIRVVTQANPYQASNNGVIKADGELTSTTPLTDGQYGITWYNRATSDIEDRTMTVSNGKVLEEALRDSVYTLKSNSESAGVYQIEQLTLDEEGLVEIVGVEFPTTSDLVSLIALDVMEGVYLVNE